MRILAAAAFVVAAPALADVSAGVSLLGGVQGAAVTYEGGRAGQAFGQLALAADLRPWRALGFDAFVLGGAPLAGGGPAGAVSLGARVGADFTNVDFRFGALVNASPGAATQVWPSFTVRAGAGDFRAVLGVFDVYGLVPARLGVDWRGFGVALVPLGVEAHAVWPVSPAVNLSAEALAYTLLGAQFVDVLAGARWTL